MNFNLKRIYFNIKRINLNLKKIINRIISKTQIILTYKKLLSE